MYHRDHLKHKSIKLQDDQMWNDYKRVRNEVTTMVRKAKKSYYDTVIENCKGNSSKLWKVLNHVTASKAKQSIPDGLVADDFNDFFNSIGETTVAHINDTDDSGVFWKSPHLKSIHKFQFTEISECLVKKSLISLGCNSANDVLDIDSKLLYLSADVIAPILTKFFNESVQLKIVLDDWKLSRITPAYKGKGCKDEMGNYRPISVIGHIPKILERQIYCQVISYLENHKLITDDQSAYLKKHNTQTSLHRVLDDWHISIDDGMFIGTCALDISKCFDTINHHILLEKLEIYGFDENVVDWFRSYLLDRGHKVRCNAKISQTKYLNIGVPQGSILGPILFLIYSNDLNNHVHLASCNLYADDVLLYCTGNDVNEVQLNLQSAIDCVKEWYDKNRLVVNCQKSNSMLVSTRQRSSFYYDASDVKICIDDHVLTEVDCINYLGVKLDSNITWSSHIESLCKDLRSKIGLFTRLRNFLPQKALLKLYNGMIQPKFDYGITVWGYTSEMNLYKIQHMQNRFARTILGNYDYFNVRGCELVKELHWLNIKQRRDYFMSVLMFKCIHGLAPDYLANQITMQIEVTDRQTRGYNENNLYIPHVNLEGAKNNFTYIGPVTWNKLPENIKECHNINAFKRESRNHFYSVMF
jgi:hypothetical protein